MSKELVKIVDLCMPFPASVIKAYSRMKMVLTSGELSREAGVPRSTAEYHVRKMVDFHMIAKIPHRKKYQKYPNAKLFSGWLTDLIRLAIRKLENAS